MSRSNVQLFYYNLYDELKMQGGKMVAAARILKTNQHVIKQWADLCLPTMLLGRRLALMISSHHLATNFTSHTITLLPLLPVLCGAPACVRTRIRPKDLNWVRTNGRTKKVFVPLAAAADFKGQTAKCGVEGRLPAHGWLGGGAREGGEGEGGGQCYSVESLR